MYLTSIQCQSAPSFVLIDGYFEVGANFFFWKTFSQAQFCTDTLVPSIDNLQCSIVKGHCVRFTASVGMKFFLMCVLVR